MSNELEGKVAFITGAARGQGRTHAVKLASMGADIVAVDIAGPVGDYIPYPPATPDDLAETQRLVENLDRRIITVEADVRDHEALKAAADQAVAELGSKVQPMMIHYTSSKHALVGMTRGFAIELGPHKIRVNSVHPGGVATPMGGGDMVDRIEESTRENPKVNQMGQSFMEPGWVEPEAISNAVAFLVSPAAEAITSEHLSVDMGTQYF